MYWIIFFIPIVLFSYVCLNFNGLFFLCLMDYFSYVYRIIFLCLMDYFFVHIWLFFFSWIFFYVLMDYFFYV